MGGGEGGFVGEGGRRGRGATALGKGRLRGEGETALEGGKGDEEFIDTLTDCTEEGMDSGRG